MKHLGLAAPEQHQHLHHYVRFTPEQLGRMTDEQLDWVAAGHTEIFALDQEVAAAEAQRAIFFGAADRTHLLIPPILRGRRETIRIESPADRGKGSPYGWQLRA